MPLLLACVIEDSTNIFGISGGGLNTPNSPPRYATGGTHIYEHTYSQEIFSVFSPCPYFCPEIWLLEMYYEVFKSSVCTAECLLNVTVKNTSLAVSFPCHVFYTGVGSCGGHFGRIACK